MSTSFPLLEEFLSEAESGTYIALKPDEQSIQKIVDYCRSAGITDATPPEGLHCTLVYSKVDIDDQVNIDPIKKYRCQATGLAILGVDEKVLVLKLKSRELSDRFNEIHKNTDATYDFDEYIPHITIRSPAGEYDESWIASEAPSVVDMIGNIVLTDEYIEALDK